MRRCNNCGISKKPSGFGRQTDKGNSYLRATCKDCRTKTEKTRYQNLTSDQKLNNKNKELNRLYGISLEIYNEMIIFQKSKCLGCGKHQLELEKALCVDHNHITGKVRGLLCAGCNIAIGTVKENPETLRQLAEYLESVSE